MIEWLSQPVTVPLWGLLVAIILPLGYFAKLARRLVDKRIPTSGGEA
jgi:hypothetical protein